MNRARLLAWVLGGGGAAACAASLVWLIALHLYVPLAVINLALIAFGLLGALVASRQPRNSMGWLMVAGSVAGSLLFLPLDYGYSALAVHHGAWPFGTTALWIESWAYAPSLGMFYPMVVARFPSGRVPRRWRAVDWLATAGTLAYGVSIALAPSRVLPGFLPTSTATAHLVSPLVQNPLGAPVSEDLLAPLRVIGLVLIVLGYVAAVLSLIVRFRHASGDERKQLQWFAYAGTLMAGSLLYGLTSQVLAGGINVVITGHSLGDALIPLTFVSSALPVAIAIAILRYRLYDIDLIINRTIVYGGLTAILGALYTALITFFNRFFIAATGQRSDAAYVITAFAVVVAFSPVKDWLQHQVDRRIRHASPATVLDGFRGDVEAVVSVLDVDRVARRLLDQAIEAFDARSAALYLDPNANPRYERGHVNGHAEVEVDIRSGDTRFGRLVLGARRGNIEYTARDVALLQRSADSVGEALALAAHLGFRPLSKAHSGKEKRT